MIVRQKKRWLSSIRLMSVVGWLLLLLVTACGALPTSPTSSTPPKTTSTQPTHHSSVGVVLDIGSENDRSFNQYTLEGARAAATHTQLDFAYVVSETGNDYEQLAHRFAEQGKDLIITVGFQMGTPTARVALQYPNTHFVTVDTAFYPGQGCAEHVADCYSAAGGLTNITSLLFAEDQMGYLAGVLAACMSNTHTIGIVAGVDIPPVVRYTTGFQQGVASFDPETTVLLTYHAAFNDPSSGKVTAQHFIKLGADVVVGAGGNTGNGGLLAAKEANVMAIGIDVDQYSSYPDVGSVLLTSAVKHMDRAAEQAVLDFANGTLTPGIHLATLANDGIGLAPYHEWDKRITPACKDAVTAAKAAVIADPTITMPAVP